MNIFKRFLMICFLMVSSINAFAEINNCEESSAAISTYEEKVIKSYKAELESSGQNSNIDIKAFYLNEGNGALQLCTLQNEPYLHYGNCKTKESSELSSYYLKAQSFYILNYCSTNSN